MKKINEINITNKRILVRVDFNVPIKNGKITDNRRIQSTLPTIKYLLAKKAKIVLISHLGRPEGKKNPELSLRPVAQELQKLIKRKVLFVDDLDKAKKIARNLRSGEICLLENLRFYPEEEKNDYKFSRELAQLGEIYVNDAFGTCHRSSASIAGITKYIPSAAGFLVAKEVNALTQLTFKPQKPFVILLGGAKVSDKIGVIKNLLPKSDQILIGGAMAFTFLRASGISVGKSKVEADKLELAEDLLKKAKRKIILPSDVVLDNNKKSFVTKIPNDRIGYDIGPKTTELFGNILKKAKTIFWNGPVGYYEKKPFDKSSKKLAVIIAKTKAITIVGGGDTADLIDKLKLATKYTHVSTGGGASLELLEGKKLPGIKALLR